MAFAILGSPKPQFFDSSGAPLSGTLTIVEPSTDVQKATYPTYDDAEALTNPNDNPITLDARGECDLWGLDGEDYKLTLKDSAGATVWTTDDVFLALSSAESVGKKLYAQNAAEIAAGVTPTNYQYEPGNVLRYGAAGDGVTDDTTAINNAITAANVSGGGVDLGSDTYIVDGTSGVVMKSNVYLLSSGATIKAKPSSANKTMRIVHFDNVSNAGVRGTLRIDGNSSNQGETRATANTTDIYMLGLKVETDCYDLHFDDIHCLNVAGTGLSIGTNTTASPSYDLHFKNVRADECWNAGGAITAGRDIVIENFHAQGCDSNTNYAQCGFDVETNSTSDVLKNITFGTLTARDGYIGFQIITHDESVQYGVTIGRANIRDNSANGISLTRVNHLNILSGESSGNTTAGIIMPTDTKNVRITMDVFSNGARGINLVQGASTFSANNIVFDGSRIFNNTGQGIQIQGSAGFPVTDVSLRGCKIFDDQGSPTQTYGLLANTNVTGVVFTGTMSGNATADFLVGTGNKINGIGVESANAETPTAASWEIGDIVDFTDSGDASGDGQYLLLTNGTSWAKLA